MTEYAKPYPHDPIVEIAPDLFMVRGSMKMNAFVNISRNMAIVRHEGDLTLINPIRLNAKGEAELQALGTVKRLIRLGSFHGIDDQYYADIFGAEMWRQPGGEAYPSPAPTVTLTEDTELPFPDAELFLFRGLNQPEGALLINKAGGVLITCDGIQHYGDYRFVTWYARPMLARMGFPKTTIIGPFWITAMVPEGLDIQIEFNRLLEMKFDKLLAAHGSLLESGAHAAVEKALKKLAAA
ncbi:MAG: hypothetical protein E2O92_09260 [Alphaproteobacteria bacterium]|nr:MAG: hypothetical protein E2O92_09260 [Alphaproteobacteria bacterium]